MLFNILQNAFPDLFFDKQNSNKMVACKSYFKNRDSKPDQDLDIHFSCNEIFLFGLYGTFCI